MSMSVLSMLQFIKILGAYSVMTLLLPAILCYQKIKALKFSVRFMVYQTIGNFYMMNLVFLLELLHISNRATLMLFTIIPFLAAYIILYRKKPKQVIWNGLEKLKRLAGGQFGIRLFCQRMAEKILGFLGKVFQICAQRLRSNFLDVLLILGLTFLLMYLYGTNAWNHYGYVMSDIPVHNYWINYMGKNQIFVAGIYPFGFHCVIYYLHTVFGIETYVLLRLFWLVQTMFIHFLLLAFIRACNKSKYAAYTGVGIYTALSIWGINTYVRYYASLPQEFGMLFILPSIYFLFAFFERKHCEQKAEKQTEETSEGIKHGSEQEALETEGTKQGAIQKADGKKEKKSSRIKNILSAIRIKKPSSWYLAGFAMSFSMTLAVHFYDTMIAGLFCLGIAAGYGFRLFRAKYFGRVMLAGILSIVIAVLPMGVAFAMGTPLQGSLGWGMNVITGSTHTSEKEEAEEETVKEDKEESEKEHTENEEVPTAEGTEGSTGSQVSENNKENTNSEAAQVSFSEKLQRLGQKVYSSVWFALTSYLVPYVQSEISLFMVISIAVLGLLSLVFFLLREADYGARMLSASVFMVFLTIMFGAVWIGLPALMDASRASIFYAYMMPVVWGFIIDGILQLLFGWLKKPQIMNVCSLLLIAAAGIFLVQEELVKEPRDIKALQSNSAVTCLTNIIHDNEDGTWTICSANDELRMAEDYGYHYEISTFLNEMEYAGGYSTITIPTKKVYFFIEKVPIDYSVPYENSGQSVSEKGAERALPKAGGIRIYQGENRWIMMSRMYYWAEKFQKLYANEMKVYYETDDFICYCIEQNEYSLYNFSIDYGYNMMEHEEYKEDRQ